MYHQLLSNGFKSLALLCDILYFLFEKPVLFLEHGVVLLILNNLQILIPISYVLHTEDRVRKRGFALFTHQLGTCRLL